MLRGKIAFITGSTRGIGWCTAEKFAENGATVILNGKSDEKVLQARVEELKTKYNAECSGFFCDISDPKHIQNCFQSLFQKYKRLDILVNNAGITEGNLLGMISQEEVQRTFAVNTFATIFTLQAAARLMGRNGGGAIVNVSSLIGVEGQYGNLVYGASKAAVICATRSAAKELGPKNIRVNAVAPGSIDTERVRQLSKKLYEERLKGIRMGRIGKPEEVANVILFLASDMASFVSGQTIGVDGCAII